MEKAIGGLPQYDSFDAMLAKMDEAGVAKGFHHPDQDVVVPQQVDVHGHPAR